MESKNNLCVTNTIKLNLGQDKSLTKGRGKTNEEKSNEDNWLRQEGGFYGKAEKAKSSKILMYIFRV